MSGIVGVVSAGNCKRDLLIMTDYHSHMGSEKAGIATLCVRRGFRQIIHSLEKHPFRSRFTEDPDFHGMNGHAGLGVISDFDVQPLLMKNRFGQMAIAASGLIGNQTSLASRMIRDGVCFLEMSCGQINMVELLGKIISQSDSLIEGVERAWQVIKGSASILIMDKEGIIAARDSWGRTPLVIGRSNNAVVVASESCGFANQGFTIEQFLGPGEIVRINLSGQVIQLRAPNKIKRVCDFLWIYTSNPGSIIDGVAVGPARIRCGLASARYETEELDCVFGMPDSGLYHGLGLSAGLGIQLVQLTAKYSTWARSFGPNSKKRRDETSRYKQLAVPDLPETVNIKRVGLSEDSLVRGTQLRNKTVPKLYSIGVEELHVRPDCPPLMWTCPYLRSTRQLKDLAARRAIFVLEGKMPKDISSYLDPNSWQYQRMVEYICKDLGIASLRYLNRDDMMQAIGLPLEDQCTYCWTGQV